MTVPRDFKRRVVPKPLKLHQGELRHFEITHVMQIPVTTPIRTIIDLLQANAIPRHHLIEALQEARQRGLITKEEMNSKFWSKDERKLLQSLENEALTYKPEA
jgi:hypothetical protein